jgi:hypothetical protein
MMLKKVNLVGDPTIEEVHTSAHCTVSVANSWQKFSARSTKKFSRWRKSSAPHKIYSKRLTLLVFSKIHNPKYLRNLNISIGRYILSQKYGYFSANQTTKKFGPFLALF